MTADYPSLHRTPRVPAVRDTGFAPHTPLGGGREFDTIRRMIERWGPRARRIGDDAAVLAGPDPQTVVSIDTSVENVHFRREWITPAEIGYRSAAAALSDLAAMGAQPFGMLAALTIPDDWRAMLDDIADGIGDAAVGCDAQILGGDLSRGEKLSLTFTVLGMAEKPLLRSGARAGDNVYMTGTVGRSLSALRAFQAGIDPSAAARRRFAHPEPRLSEARWLASAGATAAIDISDGLVADLAHIAAASRVEINIDLERIRTDAGLSLIDAASSGEEYEILATAPTELDVPEFERLFGIDLTCIGTVGDGEPALHVFFQGDEVESLTGYLHFTDEP